MPGAFQNTRAWKTLCHLPQQRQRPLNIRQYFDGKIQVSSNLPLVCISGSYNVSSGSSRDEIILMNQPRFSNTALAHAENLPV